MRLIEIHTSLISIKCRTNTGFLFDKFFVPHPELRIINGGHSAVQHVSLFTGQNNGETASSAFLLARTSIMNMRNAIYVRARTSKVST